MKPVVLDNHGLGVTSRHRRTEPLLTFPQLRHLGRPEVLNGKPVHSLIDHRGYEEEVAQGCVIHRDDTGAPVLANVNVALSANCLRTSRTGVREMPYS
jgi:hypothetical protein